MDEASAVAAIKICSSYFLIAPRISECMAFQMDRNARKSLQKNSRKKNEADAKGMLGKKEIALLLDNCRAHAQISSVSIFRHFALRPKHNKALEIINQIKYAKKHFCFLHVTKAEQNSAELNTTDENEENKDWIEIEENVRSRQLLSDEDIVESSSANRELEKKN